MYTVLPRSVPDRHKRAGERFDDLHAWIATTIPTAAIRLRKVEEVSTSHGKGAILRLKRAITSNREAAAEADYASANPTCPSDRRTGES